mmetsp:Transcript_20912/g.20644  ORF Transcript_20912/g.20644 Transcript_20912/m.20644 type:complete len:259 (-) Transcript_20912:388-1164(-)
MLGEKDENSGRNLATDPLSISLYEYTLDPLHTAKIYMDFSDVPSGFIYNTHYRITITDEDNTELTLPRYFSSSISAFENRQLEIRVHNMNSEKKTFKFGIYLLHGLFKPYKEFLRNKVSIFMYYSTRSNVKAKTTFGFLISSTFLNDITIPYNAPDVTADQTFFLDMTASIGLLPTRGYDKDVYDSTYWQSRQITSAIMSWVPFFSNCEGYDSKVLFYDIVERNSECQLPFSNQTKVVDPIPMTGMNPTADECKLQIK